MSRLCATFLWSLACLAGQSAADEPLRIKQAVLVPLEDVEISAPDAGLISTVKVREGQQVEAGDLVVSLHDLEARLLLAHAEANLRVAEQIARNRLAIQLAEKSVAVASAELVRAEETNASFPGTVSASEVDRLRLSQERAKLEVEQAQENHRQRLAEAEVKRADVQLAELQLQRRQIKAPTAGVIVEVKSQAGEWLPQGTPCCRLINLSRMCAEGTVPAAAARNLVGSPVLLQLMDGAETLDVQGTVTFVHPEINVVNGTCRIWAEFDNSDGKLRPGQSGELVIGLVAEQNTPSAAP